MIIVNFAVGNIPILVLSISYDNEPVYMVAAKEQRSRVSRLFMTLIHPRETILQKSKLKLTACDSKHTADFFNVTR